MRIALALLFALGILVAACGEGNSGDGSDDASSTECSPPAETPPPVEGESFTTAGGVEVIVISEAETPDPIAAFDVAAVHYAGWLAESGSRFDTSLDDCEPFTFQLGVGGVIAGWDEGVAGMSPGEIRRLIIPAELGYGDQGFRNSIPPGADLIFDVELIAFGRPTTPTPGP